MLQSTSSLSAIGDNRKKKLLLLERSRSPSFAASGSFAILKLWLWIVVISGGNGHRCCLRSAKGLRCPSFWPRKAAGVGVKLISPRSHLSRMSTLQSTTRDESSPSSPSEALGSVLIVGSANRDLISYAPRLPQAGETIMGCASENSSGASFEVLFGGKGANQAAAAASLGFSDVHMICKVGMDEFGRAILDNFRKLGVEHAPLYAPSPVPTGVATITVDAKGENTIVVHSGANADLSPGDVRSLFSSYQIKPAVVLLQLEIPFETALEALKLAKQMGAMTILNPAPAPPQGLPEEFFDYVDVLVPNETELEILCKSSASGNHDEVSLAKQLLQSKPKLSTIICTLGPRGAMILQRKPNDDINISHMQVSAPEDLPCNSQPVVDTIGAGDAFCGALASYISAGVTPIEKAAQLACGVAGMSVRGRGAMSSYPTRDQLPDILRIGTTASAITKPSMSTITFVTGNKNKLKEVQRMMLPDNNENDDTIPFTFIHQQLDLPELQGNDHTTIAIEKCKLASEQVTRGAVLTEDTSLCFQAMHGLPGPYIKWFLDKCGHGGLNDMLMGFEDKTATARTVLGFCPKKGDEVKLFVGETEGQIVRPRGKTDFGWDAIFEPKEGGGKTYGEMTKDEKDAISHRGRAFRKFKKYLQTETDAIMNSLEDR